MTHEKRFRWHVIHDRIKHIENPVGAEIGAHRGECSRHLLELHSGLKLYMIDMWSPDTYKGKGDDAATEPYRKIYEKECEQNYKTACAVADKYKMSAYILRGGSLEAVKWVMDNTLDFAFIDASHSYEDVKADILAWLPKIKPGGFIAMHDFGLFEGVTRAVNELFPSDAKHLNWIELDSDYMAVVRV